MFRLLNKEIEEYRVLNNRNPEIFMGIKTHKVLSTLYVKNEHPYLSIDELKELGLISIYKGIKVNKTDFDYGYYLK